MRILGSQLHGSVDKNSHQETSLLTVTKSQQGHTELGENQQVIGTRETINLHFSQQYESEKASRLYTQSSITDLEQGTQQSISQEELSRSIVSGVLEHDVHIGDVVYANSSSEHVAFIDKLGLSHDDKQALQTIKQPTSEGVANSTEISVNQQQLIENSDSLTLINEGEVSTADGRSISFRLELELDSNYTEISNQQLKVRSEEFVDPLVISLDGRAPSLNNATFNFDIDSDGIDDPLSQLSSGAGFLAFDKNQDGLINNGQELFGPQSGNGYQDLAAYDDNGDGWIDESDDVFHQLSIWQPTNDNNEEGRLQSLNDAGVGAISLKALESPFTLKDDHNNILGMVQRSGVFLKENGEVGLVQQIDLAIQQDKTNIKPTEAAFYEQAEKLDQLFQKHISENEELLLNQPIVDIDLASIQSAAARFELEVSAEDIELDEDSLPMLIIMSHFQIESQHQENTYQQTTSSRNVTTSLPETTPETTLDETGDATIGTSAPHKFSVTSQHDTSSLDQLRSRNEEPRSFRSSIIEDVLKPLHEQLKLKRQQAIDSYTKNLGIDKH